MTITKFVHACLLVETEDRVALFDPGMMSAEALGKHTLTQLDDIFITHIHPDHYHLETLQRLTEQFPRVRITATAETVAALQEHGIEANIDAPEGAVIFESPHESVAPLYPQPQENGYHYLNVLTHPGDSHRFTQTKTILALPITGPWGSTIVALNLALALKPHHVIPIHDWHWNDEARAQTYDNYERILGEQGITFHKAKTGTPISIIT
jgi:L-ascorbate metabolism protein UlaG (beta-lactamase superfamily)